MKTDLERNDGISFGIIDFAYEREIEFPESVRVLLHSIAANAERMGGKQIFLFFELALRMNSNGSNGRKEESPIAICAAHTGISEVIARWVGPMIGWISSNESVPLECCESPLDVRLFQSRLVSNFGNGRTDVRRTQCGKYDRSQFGPVQIVGSEYLRLYI